jgi:hypothetical protein
LANCRYGNGNGQDLQRGDPSANAHQPSSHQMIMSNKLLNVLCWVLFFTCAGCESTNPPASVQPVAAVGTQVPSKRIYDTSYIPRALWAKVDANGDGFVDKNVEVNQLRADGRSVYGVTRDGETNYYNTQGAEITGADRTRVLSQLGIVKK